MVLANASTIWLTALGAALWGLQLGVTQRLLGATIADVAPERLRGTAFGIYDVAIGIGVYRECRSRRNLDGWWTISGLRFSACIAISAALLLMLRPLPQTMNPAH